MSMNTTEPAVAAQDFEPLWEDEERQLFRGTIPHADGAPTPVLLSVPRQSFAHQEGADRLLHELQFNEHLSRDWAIPPLKHDGGSLYLHDPGGVVLASLASSRLPIEQLLEISVAIATSVARMHAAGVLHKDIKSANILWHAKANAAYLTGFGIATRLTREHKASSHADSTIGTLAYMAPEQTGRMNRVVDVRSDLYSLGVTLYELMTGVLPFTANSPSEWAHCHLARQPAVPHDRRADLPRQLSDVVMRLLSKAAEDRYQTAFGLESDLRKCLHEWRTHRKIELFALGVHDVSATLQFRDCLYGREDEMGLLVSTFTEVASTGESRVVLVSGYSGVGKSALVHEFQKVLVPTQATFAFGKFDQYRTDVPFSTLAQAFLGLVRGILGQPDQEMKIWRTKVQKALGTNGQVIVNLIPELQHLVGEQPPVPDLSGTEARNRFLQVFGSFVSIFARKEHPLVLFLDDLQWLDASTLDVFESLASLSTVHYLMLVGSYRSNEIDGQSELGRNLNRLRNALRPPLELRLRGIGSYNMTQMIADAVHVSPDAVSELASCIVEKTDDNPFFAVHFIGALVEKSLLAYDSISCTWHWDLDRIRGEMVAENIVDLMIERLNRLPKDALQIVQAMACTGSRTDRNTLAIVLDSPELATNEALRGAVKSGLILESADDYAFAHDRIHEAAYAMLTPRHQQEAHWTIGKRLIEHTPERDLAHRVFEIVSHLNRTERSKSTDKDRLQLASLNLQAGRKARGSAAYGAACEYLATGRALLREPSPVDDHALAFTLALELAECTFLGGGIEAAKAMVEALLVEAKTGLETAATYRLKVELHMVSSEHSQALSASLTALSRLGITLNAYPDQQEVLAAFESVWRNLAGRPLQSIADLPAMVDPPKLLSMRILGETWPPASFANMNLAILVVCKMVNLSLDYGSAKASNQGFALFGLLIGPSLGRYREGLELAQLACDLAVSGNARQEANRTFNTMALTCAWTQPLEKSADWARLAYRKAIEAGDVYFACYSAFHASIHSFMRGRELSQEALECKEHLRFATERGFSDGAALMTAIERSIASLRGKTRSLTDYTDDCFDGASFQEAMSSTRHLTVCQFYWTMKTMLHYFAGEPEAALAATSNLVSGRGLEKYMVRHVEHHFYSALAAASVLATSTEGCHSVRVRFDESRRAIAKWSEETQSPTFICRDLLIRAELAKLEGRILDAEQLYEKSAGAARKEGFLQCEALSLELAARFNYDRGLDRLAEIYIQEALACYDRWGAQGKVKLLLKEHPGLRQRNTDKTSPASLQLRMGQLDYVTVIKGSRAVSGELLADKLVTTLMRAVVEQAGANRGVLLRITGKDAFAVSAEAIASEDEVTVHMHDHSAEHQELPGSVLQALSDNDYRLAIDDASIDERVSHDPYISRNKVRSVLCLPVASYGRPQFLLYLENRTAPRVFTAPVLNVLKLLTTHAAISLENTRLYADLAARDSKIRRLVDSDIIGIIFWDLSGELTDANDAFLRMVGYSREDLKAGKLRWRDMTPPEWMDGQRERLRELKATGAMRPWEKEYIRKDGSRLPIMIGAATFDGTPLKGVAFVLDLSERKAAEMRARASELRNRELLDELAHANRVATMGQLSTWIAHDVMQPLTRIETSGDAGLRWLLAEEPNLDAARHSLTLVVREGMRAAEVLDRTRELVKKVSPRSEIVDINQVVSTTVALISPEAQRKGINVTVSLAERPMLAIADRVQLQQVVLNLLVNAIEALNESTDSERELYVASAVDHEDGLQVTVRDNGAGLHAASSEKCFDAFFTTKSDSIGIGLSICRGIVEQFGGRIWATRNEPKGAVFHFVLPRRDFEGSPPKM